MSQLTEGDTGKFSFAFQAKVSTRHHTICETDSKPCVRSSCQPENTGSGVERLEASTVPQGTERKSRLANNGSSLSVHRMTANPQC